MRLLDTFPTHKTGGVEYRVGRPLPFGASIVEGGVNFSIYSKEATDAWLLLFDQDSDAPFVKLHLSDEFRLGNVYSIMVFGINEETTEYGYCFDGPYDREKGLLFDKTKILLDPYARSVSGRTIWGQEPKAGQSFVHRGKIIREDYDWEGDRLLNIPVEDLIIYEAHVRSFTAHESSGVRYPGTFAGMLEKIPYLKALGINCIELMPIFEFDEFENSRVIDGQRLYNYWGYSTVDFFAPKAGYAASARVGLEADELKNMVKLFHKNGIEVILDVVFNHTAEGNENGPYISYRGIDNRTYYLLTPDGSYYNFSGCGNTMNCNNPVVRECILDCLRYWVTNYHIDGFRFDLASILSRDENGAPMLYPPLLETLAYDAVLGSCTLIAEAWDAGGLYQVGSFPSWNRFSEWNGRYRDCLRRFIKGDAGAAGELYQRIRGSQDLYGSRSSSASINFVTCHDGFTLYDLVSYNEKHNENNGEENRDGANDNNSWNCGAEGETNDKDIKALRLRQMENMLTVLLTSRGIPMLLSGDEFKNTQFGNNNAYCQDNEISWLDWKRVEKEKELLNFVKALIALRKAHPVLRAKTYDFGNNGTGYPELSFHSTMPWQLDEGSENLVFSYMYAEDKEKYGTEKDCFIYVAVNAHWEDHVFKLPIVPEGMKWHTAMISGEKAFMPGKEALRKEQEELHLSARSTAVLIAK